MASVSEDSPQFFVGESSDTFPWSDVLQECKPFFRKKVQYRFPSVGKSNPLRERIVARLSQDWAELPTIGPNLSEHSRYLPITTTGETDGKCPGM